MQLGFVGLGRMGLNMVTRLVQGGHHVAAYDRNPDQTARAREAGASGVASLEALVQALAPPRSVWIMVPAGGATESTVTSRMGLPDFRAARSRSAGRSEASTTRGISRERCANAVR